MAALETIIQSNYGIGSPAEFVGNALLSIYKNDGRMATIISVDTVLYVKSA